MDVENVLCYVLLSALPVAVAAQQPNKDRRVSAKGASSVFAIHLHFLAFISAKGASSVFAIHLHFLVFISAKGASSIFAIYIYIYISISWLRFLESHIKCFPE